MLSGQATGKRRDNEPYGSWSSLCRTSFLSFTHGGGVLSCWHKLSPPGNMESIKGCKWSATISVCVSHLSRQTPVSLVGFLSFKRIHTITNLPPACTTLLFHVVSSMHKLVHYRATTSLHSTLLPDWIYSYIHS